MNHLYVFAVLLIAIAGSDAFLFNVTVNTGLTYFKPVNGSIKVTVQGTGCSDTYFVAVEGRELTHKTSYIKTHDLNCNVQQIKQVEVRFTKKDSFFSGPREIIVRNVQLSPEYIQNPIFRQYEMLTFTSSSAEVTIKHKDTHVFSTKTVGAFPYSYIPSTFSFFNRN